MFHISYGGFLKYGPKAFTLDWDFPLQLIHLNYSNRVPPMTMEPPYGN